MRRVPVIAALAMLIGTLTACGGDAGPPEGFDVSGTWQERDGASTITFTSTGGYDIVFAPGLSDGTTRFGGESFTRVDNTRLRFTVLLGFTVTEVTATIGSDEVLSFDLDGRRFRFTKGG